jgi:hypothetical protein
MVMKYFSCVLIFIFALPLVSAASELIVEVGTFRTDTFSISSGESADATEGWDSDLNPTVRFERWSDRSGESWSFGLIVQPFQVNYEDKLTADLKIDETLFNKGDSAKINFQFHNIRLTANYPIFTWGESFLRLGITIVSRYAGIEYTANNGTEKEDGILTIPLANIMLFQKFSQQTSFSIQGDFLSSGVGSVYDFFFGPRFGSWEIGARAFWGGFEPKKTGTSNSQIFFSAIVLRKYF